MNRFQKKFIYYLPHRIAHKIMYKLKYNETLDLKNPQTIDEKIHWLILNEYGNREAMLTDKYQVRGYVKDKGYEKNLITLYKVYNSVEEINLSELPNNFVLKANNSSGKIFICLDKSNFDFERVKIELNRQLKDNYASNQLEYHYSKIKPKIICEEYIGDKDGSLPIDYKFFCFNGKVDCIMCCTEREKKVKYDYYDINWNPLNYTLEKYSSKKNIQKPEKLEDMIKMAEALSKEFKIVRVDLYQIKDKIYFGELTFTPFGGSFYANTKESRIKLGNKLFI